ncbi:hypothetical protein [Sphingomonas quercus]|uniref:Uncharacterized protein n=1 Tax=Sphingomonas quercus TaxID=2842451 RepID=A0ABS6BEI8_9SPHN|nr:hypothetical protein [Sphingomonas quercus]MBU3076728.1 hypothetical protein [Sphingomonas quercus]
MADDVNKVLDEDAEDEFAIAESLAVPGSGSTQGSANAIPDRDGTLLPADELEEEAVRLRRRAIGNAIDDNAASHMGGMGAQGGQADFGSAGNLADYDTSKI